MAASSPAPTTLLVVGADPPPQVARLAGRMEILIADRARLPAQLRAADAVLVWTPVLGRGADLCDALPDAWPAGTAGPRWVHTASAGVDRLLFPGLVESEAVLTNSRGVFEQPLAEYATALVLAMAKDLRGTWELQRQRRWQHRVTMRVRGSSAVVVGSGPIGREIAASLRALGVRTELVGRTARAGVHAGSELHRLLPEADWVVCAAPLTDSTRGMFDARAFAAMRPGARFVNVARGPLVVEEDLRSALLTRRLAGAALDVFQQEPLPRDHPLWDTPGLIVSPHMGSDTFGWLDDLAEVFLDNLERWTTGRELRNVVDKKLGYVPVDDPAGPGNPSDPREGAA